MVFNESHAELGQLLVGQVVPQLPSALHPSEVTLGPKAHSDLLAITRFARPKKLNIRADNGQLNLLAVSCKPGTLDDLSKRAKELLLLEKTYWAVRHVRWLLITPQEYEKSVGLTLRRIAPWGLAEPVEPKLLQIACQVACALMSCSATEVLRQLSVVLTGRDDDLSSAQHALWQSVWTGHLPIDLRRGYRLHTPLAHVSKERFSELNPLAMGRSAWI